MKRTLSAAAVGVILLTSAACGEDSDGTATSSPQDSPLTEYLGGGAGGGPGMSVSINGSDNDADQEQQQRVQQLVVECMKEAGFEYLPYVPTFPEMQPMIEGDREWAATYGYGITTVDAPTPDSSDDPNTAITERMSDSERAAYDKALYGSGMTISGSGGPGRLAVAGPAGGGPVAAPDGAMPPSGDTPPSDATAPSGASSDATPSSEATSSAEDGPTGCFPTASAEVYGEPAEFDGEEFTSLFESLGKLATSVDDDPRVSPLVTQWSNCVADAGYPGMTEIEDARNSIFSKWADLNGWEFTPVEGGGASVTAIGSQDAPQLDPVLVAELREEEIALAVSDLGCRGDYQTVHDEVRVELEKQFVQDHLEELERYRDVTGGGN